MREEYRLKYISNRIFLIAVIIFLYFAEEAVRNVLLELRGEETMFRACIHVLIALLYFLVVWFGVVLPYRRSELLVRRFRGSVSKPVHEKTDGRDRKNPTFSKDD